MRIRAPGSAYVGVVDDDENLRRSFARLLRASGMTPITYVSAEAFLDDKTQPPLECLILDVELPGMSGLKLQELLHDRGIKTAIIFITAHENVLAREQAYATGCAGYFRKSDSGHDVLNAIKDVLSRLQNPTPKSGSKGTE
jgi:FixJ family two-component response regulator